MSADLSSLSRLMQSRSPKAQMMGLIICFVVFLPHVFRVAGDSSLTIWQRLEQLSVAAGQTLLTAAALAFPPELLSEDTKRSSEEQSE